MFLNCILNMGYMALVIKQGEKQFLTMKSWGNLQARHELHQPFGIWPGESGPKRRAWHGMAGAPQLRYHGCHSINDCGWLVLWNTAFIFYIL